MLRSLPKTLIRSALFSSSAPRRLSTLPEATTVVELTLAEANLVEKIEDAIHSNIVKKSKPDWLVFVPGASYWVPPRRSSYGVAEIVNHLTNPISEEQTLACLTLQGYPSAKFFLSNDETEDDSRTDETKDGSPTDDTNAGITPDGTVNEES